MSTDFWNSRYAEPGYAYGTEPNAFLVSVALGVLPLATLAHPCASQQKLLKPGGKALAVADGEGRNGVWLAQQGLDVLSVDASEVGVRETQELGAGRGGAGRTKQAEPHT